MLLGVIATTGMLHAQQARDVIREETLRQQVTATPTLKSHLSAKARPLTNQAPPVQSSLWRNSIILSDGEKFTLVPVGSILHLPSELRARVIAKPQGDFTFWPSFLQRNAAWLAAKEVSLKLSRGNAQEANALLKSLSHDPHLVVATYKGGPITILEPASASPGVKPTPP
jgi:hypothetical protein